MFLRDSIVHGAGEMATRSLEELKQSVIDIYMILKRGVQT